MKSGPKLKEKEKNRIASVLAKEYLEVTQWPLQTTEGIHGARLAIRCCAASLGVYSHFNLAIEKIARSKHEG